MKIIYRNRIFRLFLWDTLTTNSAKRPHLANFSDSISVNDRWVSFDWRWKQICRQVSLEPVVLPLNNREQKYYAQVTVFQQKNKEKSEKQKQKLKHQWTNGYSNQWVNYSSQKIVNGWLVSAHRLAKNNICSDRKFLCWVLMEILPIKTWRMMSSSAVVQISYLPLVSCVL